MKGKVLVAGIGNIFLGDDAFGVEVAARLTHRRLPENVVVRDFGIRSYDLAYALMEDWDLAILVDALPRGGPPGTVYALEPQLPENGAVPPVLDAHSMNPVAVLQLVSALGGSCSNLIVVGCEPATVEPDDEGKIGLSEPAAAAVEEALNVVEELIERARSRKTAA
ncbi:MAG TPA: hydrogenase maturation protease [Terriglobales bacterium]|nr:hydrogenase maturation protease [Terriglobales bacterium]